MFQTFTLDKSLLGPMSPWTKVFLDNSPLDKCINTKFHYFELQFFPNIFILIVLSDSTIEMLGYRRSCGVTSEEFEILRI